MGLLDFARKKSATSAEVYTSNSQHQMVEGKATFKPDKNSEFNLIKVYPNHLRQEVLGFGGSFTESSATVFNSLSESKKKQILEHYFSPDGCNYNFCRTHIQSCDFSLENYSYVSDKDDSELETFSLERDEKDLIPFMKQALAVNPQIEIMASPWSPPDFMKSNSSMNKGGQLKEDSYDQWARMVALYVEKMKAAGVPVTRLTVQNEPLASQNWDSCLYTAEEEGRFFRDYLKPALKALSLEDIKVLLWDHNKDRFIDRIDGFLDAGIDLDDADGFAFHWYSGDHFEALEEIAHLYPNKELVMSEMSLRFSASSRQGIRVAEQYAHEIIGDFNAGAQAFVDWNLLLDKKGGPNHAGNNCNAPIMVDTSNDSFTIGIESYYIAHFSRFVQKGARRMVVSRAIDTVETLGFVNPDESRVLVVLNRGVRPYKMKLLDGDSFLSHRVEGRSIVTFVWDAE